VAQKIRDAYGRQPWVLYRLTPFDSLRAALFFDLRHAGTLSANLGSRTCLGDYVTLRDSGTLRYRISWLDTNTEDGRIAVEIITGTPPALVDRLNRALEGGQPKGTVNRLQSPSRKRER
jgi:hypothetical protein